MSTTWILVADNAKARLFAWTSEDRAIAEIAGFANPRGRGRVPARDRPPRTHDRFGNNRHVIQPHTLPEQKAVDAFAHELDEALERGRVDHRYDDLVVIAPAQFLGALNAAMGKQVRTKVVASLSKDLTGKSVSEIIARLPEDLRLLDIRKQAH